MVPVLAELFVAAALIGIGKHLIGLTDLLEAGLGSLVAGVDIGVVLARELAEGAFDRLGVGAPFDLKHLEVIAITVRFHRFRFIGSC